MGYPTKIATCCHCGTRATLRVDESRHALSCANCGAPLSNFKMLPKPKKKAAAVSHTAPPRAFEPAAQAAQYKRKKPKKAKSRSRWFKKVAEGVFDIVEEIFD